MSLNNDNIRVIKQLIENRVKDIYTALPVEIVEYDYKTQRLKVKILFKQSINGDKKEYPYLIDILPTIQQADKWCITLPFKPGDQGLALFTKLALDNFYKSIEDTPNDNRHHHITDAIYVAGLNSNAKVLSNYIDDGVSIQTRDGVTHFRVKDNIIDMTASTINITGDIIHKGNLNHTGDSDISGNIQQKGNMERSGNTQLTGNTVQTGSISNTGTLTQMGAITALSLAASGAVSAADVSAGGVSFKSHVHGGVEPGSGTTGTPK